MGYADAGVSGSVAGSSSTEDIRSQPMSGLTSSGGVVAPIPDSDPAAPDARHERLREPGDRRLQRGLVLVGQVAGLPDRRRDLRMAGLQVVVERRHEPLGILDRIVVEVAAGHHVDGHDLAFDGLRLVLRLLQDLDDPSAARELLPRRLVELRAELRERLQRAVLREVQAQSPGDLLHRLDLRVAAHARHRDADVDRRPHAGEEQLGLEEDLPVGDRDDVGRDVGGDVAALRLDDGQRREGPTTQIVGELRGALQQARVQVEHVARIRLASRRPAQQQRDLTVGDRLLGQVVVDDQRAVALVHPVGAERRARVRRDVLERRRVRRRSVHDDGVLERPVLAERLDDLRDRGGLLPDRDVDALHGAVGAPVLALGDDRVDGHRGLAGLAVADDQLALTTPDGRHRVDRRDARVQRLLHRLARDDVRRLHLQVAALGRRDRALVVERTPERVHDPPQEPVADRHREDRARLLDGVALLDLVGLAQDDAPDLVHVQVERQSEDPAGELQELVRHGPGQTLRPGPRRRPSR